MGSKAILKTLLYSNIFNYPLTKEEVFQSLITNETFTKEEVFQSLKKIKKISFKNGFYFLKGRDYIVELRRKREKQSLEKIKIAKNIARKLSLIPTIKLIGISGNLSLKNADEEDDIDFFIIAKKNTVWITRFFTILILKLLGKHRKRKDKNVKNKICLNMFLDEGHIKFKKNIYLAHEIIQLLPILNKDNTYQKFLNKNIWVFNYMPNSMKIIERNYPNIDTKKSLFRYLDYLFMVPQLFYMKRHITSEKISNESLFFHPFDHQKRILREYKKSLKKDL